MFTFVSHTMKMVIMSSENLKLNRQGCFEKLGYENFLTAMM